VTIPFVRSRGRAVVLLAALGALSLAAAAPTWLSTTVSTALEPEVAITVAGTTAAPAVSAAALVVVAAGLVLAIAGPVTRWVALVVAALSGVLVTVSAAAVIAEPVPAATAGAADAAGVTDLTSPVVVAPWPWVVVALGVLTVLVAVLAAVAARSWTATSSRHERTTTRRPASQAPADPPGADSHQDWDALSQGTDPSADR